MPAAPERAVALTFDDLPFVGSLQDAARVEAATAGILQALADHEAPASGFVTSRNVFHEGQVDLRMEALRRWVRAGHSLENHTWSHPDFQKTSLIRYQDDAVQGDVIPRLLMAEAGREPRYFRHPMNHTGKSRLEKNDFEAFMAKRGYTIVPFTVEHADYIYNALYEDALRRQDGTDAERLCRAYLDHLEQALEFAEKLSVDTFGREIPQIFLLHANALNGRLMSDMLGFLEARGYRFIPLDEALEDPAIRTRDDYVGRSGISWLHRWRMTLDKPDRLREEPDPPGEVLRAYQALRRAIRPSGP